MTTGATVTTFGSQETERYTMGDRKFTRLPHDVRYKQILDKAVELVIADGLANLTRDGLAEFAGISQGQIGYYFEDMDGLREAIVLRAIENQNIEVLAEAMRYKHPAIYNLSEKLRKAAIKILIG